MSTSHETSPTPDAPASSGPLDALARRWPYTIFGLAVGAVVAVLIHLTSSPVYQSSAQVLVLKKRTELASGSDARMGLLEDYVATQVTLIKSEKIRVSAVRELRGMKLSNPLPTDDRDVAEMIRAGLAVTRDKDTSSASQGGSGILNLTFRGGNPADCRRVLEAVIKAYQGELFALYDQATLDRIATLDKTIDAIKSQRKEAAEERLRRLTELRRITTEEVASIRSRVSAQKDKLYSLQLETIDLQDQLDLIARTGNNRRDRLAAFAQLTAQSRPVGLLADPAGPESTLRTLEAQRSELGQELGKDHPKIKAIDAQIAFFKDEIRRQNPDDGAGSLDELAAYGKRLAQRKRTTELQTRLIEARLAEDERKLVDAGAVQDRIEATTAQVQQADREVSRLEGEKLTTQVTQGSGGYSAQQITPPADGGKVGPVLYQSAILGLAFGLLVAGGMTLLSEWTDRGFRSPADIRKRLGLAVIGQVPHIKRSRTLEEGAPGVDPVLTVAHKPRSVEAEAYRGIRTRIDFALQGIACPVVQVTSPTPGDGKSTLAANLALAEAKSGRRVLLIDADMRKPRIDKLFRVDAGKIGLSGSIAGSDTIDAALVPSGIDSLTLLPCGPRPADPAELLTSPRFVDLLTQLRTRFDMIIVDSPPLLAVSDPAIVAPRADGVLLVFRLTRSVRPAAERAREQLAALGAKVLGVVLNGQAVSGRSYGGYNQRYVQYEYAEAYEDDPAVTG